MNEVSQRCLAAGDAARIALPVGAREDVTTTGTMTAVLITLADGREARGESRYGYFLARGKAAVQLGLGEVRRYVE